MFAASASVCPNLSVSLCVCMGLVVVIAPGWLVSRLVQASGARRNAAQAGKQNGSGGGDVDDSLYIVVNDPNDLELRRVLVKVNLAWCVLAMS